MGPLSLNAVLAFITPLFGRSKVLFPIPPKRDKKELRYLKEMIESGRLWPVIGRRYGLDQIVEAYRYVETGQKIGNVVIVVTRPCRDVARSARHGTDEPVGPVLTGELLTVEGGLIRSITLLFDWGRWPEVLQELDRHTAQPAVADV